MLNRVLLFEVVKELFSFPLRYTTDTVISNCSNQSSLEKKVHLITILFLPAKIISALDSSVKVSFSRNSGVK